MLVADEVVLQDYRREGVIAKRLKERLGAGKNEHHSVSHTFARTK